MPDGGDFSTLFDGVCLLSFLLAVLANYRVSRVSNGKG